MSKDDEAKKVFIVDTSRIIYDPKCLLGFEDGIVVVPFPVLEELDRHKSRENGTAAYAREAIRILNDFRKKGHLDRGVETPGGGILLVDNKINASNSLGPKVNTTDNFIIEVALKWKSRISRIKEENSGSEQDIISELAKCYKLGDVYIVTNDINLKLKADARGALVDPRDDAVEADNQSYSGIVRIPVDESCFGDVSRLIGETNGGKIFLRKQLEESVKLPELFPNQCCIFECGEEYTLAIYKETRDFSSSHFVYVPNPVRVSKPKNDGHREIEPRNIEQSFAYALLMDKTVTLITLDGIAGSGKTLMALLAGLKQLDNTYQQALIYRSNMEIGESLGYLKGSLEEKFAPWAQPILDILELLANGHDDQNHQHGKDTTKNRGPLFDIGGINSKKKIVILPINYIRGRTFHSKYVVVDESQNFKPGDLKKVITRVGRNTKIVLTGDIDQIDNLYLDKRSNGLAHVIRKMKGQPMFGHVTFPKSERSFLAELAATIL